MQEMMLPGVFLIVWEILTDLLYVKASGRMREEHFSSSEKSKEAAGLERYHG